LWGLSGLLFVILKTRAKLKDIGRKLTYNLQNNKEITSADSMTEK